MRTGIGTGSSSSSSSGSRGIQMLLPRTGLLFNELVDHLVDVLVSNDGDMVDYLIAVRIVSIYFAAAAAIGQEWSATTSCIRNARQTAKFKTPAFTTVCLLLFCTLKAQHLFPDQNQIM